MDKISDHCLICGFGRMGRSLANELQLRGTPIIIIDTKEEIIEECRQLDIPAVLGNASDEDSRHYRK